MHQRDVERFDRAFFRVGVEVEFGSMLERARLRRLNAAGVVRDDTFVGVAEVIEVDLRSKALELGGYRRSLIVVLKQTIVDCQMFDLNGHRRARRLLRLWWLEQIRAAVRFCSHENDRMIDREAIDLHLMME